MEDVRTAWILRRMHHHAQAARTLKSGSPAEGRAPHACVPPVATATGCDRHDGESRHHHRHPRGQRPRPTLPRPREEPGAPPRPGGSQAARTYVGASNSAARFTGGGEPPALPATIRNSLALHFAADAGRDGSARLLLDLAPETVDQRDPLGRTPLMYAAYRRRVAVVRLLLQRGASPGAHDQDKSTPLMYAAAGGCPTCCALLARAGADVEARNVDGFTCIVYAAENHCVEALAGLLALGCSPFAASNNGSTALHWAAKCGDWAVCDLLLGAGATLDAPNARGITPLMFAAASSASPQGTFAIVRNLLGLGARLDARDVDGCTPLMYAAYTGNAHVVRHLLASGARKDLTNNMGSTALMYSAYQGKVRAAWALLEAADDPERPDAEDAMDVDDLGPARAAAGQPRRGLDAAGVHAKDKEGLDAGHWARIGGHAATIALLEQCAAGIPHEWSPAAHARYPAAVRAKVQALVRANARLGLPTEILHHICGALAFAETWGWMLGGGGK